MVAPIQWTFQIGAPRRPESTGGGSWTFSSSLGGWPFGCSLPASPSWSTAPLARSLTACSRPSSPTAPVPCLFTAVTSRPRAATISGSPNSLPECWLSSSESSSRFQSGSSRRSSQLSICARLLVASSPSEASLMSSKFWSGRFGSSM